MVLKGGLPVGGVVRPYEFYGQDFDKATASILLPTDPTLTRHYRISFSGTVQNSDVPPKKYSKDVVLTTPITVSPDPTGAYAKVPLSPFIVSPGETLVGVAADSVRVARSFEKVTTFSNDPYEYQLLDPTLGVILFNPAGFNYRVRQGEGQAVPLVGRVNYNVCDWRILLFLSSTTPLTASPIWLKFRNLGD